MKSLVTSASGVQWPDLGQTTSLEEPAFYVREHT